jgi:hypothetical protein
MDRRASGERKKFHQADAFFRTQKFLSHEISPILRNSKGSLPYSKQPSTCSYFQVDYFSLVMFLKDISLSVPKVFAKDLSQVQAISSIS